MIPSPEELIQKVSPNHIYFMLLNGPSYFSLADEYVTLQKIFVKESFFEKLGIWVDMIISPLMTILHSIWKRAMPSLFTMLSFQKCVTLWKQWFRFNELKRQVHEWMNIVRAIGGPFISSNDPDYHMFVYADAMQRLHSGLTTAIAEKRAKRLQ